MVVRESEGERSAVAVSDGVSVSVALLMLTMLYVCETVIARDTVAARRWVEEKEGLLLSVPTRVVASVTVVLPEIISVVVCDCCGVGRV